MAEFPTQTIINNSMKIRDIIGEAAGVGLVVPGVNMPKGIHPDEIRRQAKKFRLKVSKDGRPPIAKTNGSDVKNINEIDAADSIQPLVITQDMIENAQEMGKIDNTTVYGINDGKTLLVFFKKDNSISAYIAINPTEDNDEFHRLVRMNNITSPKGSITALLVFLHKKYKVKYKIADDEPLTKLGLDWLCKILDNGFGFNITDGDGNIVTSDIVRKSWNTARYSGSPTKLSILVNAINAPSYVTETWSGILQPYIKYIGDTTIE